MRKMGLTSNFNLIKFQFLFNTISNELDNEQWAKKRQISVYVSISSSPLEKSRAIDLGSKKFPSL